ncbi:MAG: phenylalanine--tRNA ligase subunit beta [Alphaproteobacteria bacterium]|nr:phenylalanine--tRNA ligase subunit beta [Alphaproteobacteria bacterium]
MKFTWSWLKDHLDTSEDMATILDALPMLGLEVESLVDNAASLAPFTIAKIETASKHPNADSLQVCTVNTGKGTIEVVCGAPNARAGLVGVFAPVGSYVPGIDLTLTEAEIRGVTSNGMMCSEREMMLSDEHDGIIELDDDAPLGESYAEWAGLNDPVIEIAITPNRADCLGVRGVARDLAAAGYGTLKPLQADPVKAEGDSLITWNIDASAADLCPRVTGRSFSGVTNGASPRWMQQRLNAVGQRPLSALVDITNYIMIDLGRPLHAYDADKISGDTLTIRLAKDGEEFTALNEKTYKLDGEMITIADAHGADDLAGIMGGERTGISDATTSMFLEIAIFDQISVATTGRKLNLNSDARYRFERGLDVTSPDTTMDYVSAMVVSICGGTASAITEAGAGADWQRQIAYRPARCAELTAVDVAPAKQAEILETLGFTVSQNSADDWAVAPPPWRGDIVGSADLVEEITRIVGFDAIPEVALPRLNVVAAPAVDAAQKRPHTIRRLLASRGMMEAVTFSFLDAKTAQRFGGGDLALTLVNAISSDLTTMRPTIMPNLLAALMRNNARGEADAAIFEVGPIFPADGPEDQRTSTAGLRVGMTAPREWTGAARPVDWADARADAMAVLAGLGVNTDSLQTTTEAPDWYHPGQSGALCQGRKVLACFGAIHPAVIADYDLKGPAAGFEINLEDVMLPKAKGPARPLAQLSPYQQVSRDFAFILDRSVTSEQLLRAIKGAGKPLVSSAVVFDVYQGKGIADDAKSVAVAVTLQPTKATLTEDEIEATSSAIVAAVAKHCGGTLRG